VLSWLKALQAQQSELQQYEYSSLLDIQVWSDMPRGVPLFESIFVFENLPAAAPIKPRRAVPNSMKTAALAQTLVIR